MERAVRSRSGSALGLSQPLSGFLATPSFAALFRAAASSWDLPLERSPRKDRAPLSRPLAPLPSSTDVPNRTARALSPPVSPTPALLAQLPGSPSDYGLPFRRPKPASQSSWTRAAESIHSASFTDFEASLPLRIRSRPARVAPTWRSILLWVSSPLGSSPSTPRVLDPPWASRTQSTSLHPKASGPRPSRPAASRAG